MRTIALAEAARRRGLRPHFVLGGSSHALDQVEVRGFSAITVDSADPASWLDEVDADDFVVFDGYHFDPEVMQSACRRASRVGAVDDLGHGTFPVDVLLNQNLPEQTRYTVPASAVVLVGPRYALVREEFLVRRRRRGADEPGTLLITMGGSDVVGLTQHVVELALDQPAFDRLLVVIGPAAALTSVDEYHTDVDVVRSPADVGGTFARADAALSAAGSTTWELLAMGLPTGLVQIADNQRDIGRGVAREGAALFMGAPRDLVGTFNATVAKLADPWQRKQLSDRALSLVDGRGADRFLDALGCKPVSGQ